MLIISLGILGFIGIHFIAPKAIIQPTRVHLNVSPSKYNIKYRSLSITTKDHIELKGYHILSQTDKTSGVMVLIHGVGGCKEHFIALAVKLASMGITSYLFDGRAHGQSTGKYCTYGYYEKFDIQQIVDLAKIEYPNAPLGIWGNSLGGAIAIQALAIDKRLEFGIIESTFTDLHQITFDYKKRMLKGIGVRAISDYALGRAAKIANFKPHHIRPIDDVTCIEQPIFLAHGDNDQHINIDYGTALFKALKSKDKTWYPVKGGAHTNLSKVGGSEYRKALFDFVKRNIER